MSKDHLLKRKQTVIFHGTNSALKNITCGVPQGSILGPLLFLIYINDLSVVSQVTFPIMFADDTNFFIQGENWEKMENDLNIELKKLTIWLKTNKLPLNIKKHIQ